MKHQAAPEEVAIDRMADAASDYVMERLHVIVRRAVEREVRQELASQWEQLDEERARAARPLPPALIPTPELVTAAARVAAAATALENDKFTRGERVAAERLEKAIDELKAAYRIYRQQKGFGS